MTFSCYSLPLISYAVFSFMMLFLISLVAAEFVYLRFLNFSTRFMYLNKFTFINGFILSRSARYARYTCAKLQSGKPVTSEELYFLCTFAHNAYFYLPHYMLKPTDENQQL